MTLEFIIRLKLDRLRFTFIRALKSKKISISFCTKRTQLTLLRYKDILLYILMYFLMLKSIKKYIVASKPFCMECDIVLPVNLKPYML